MPKIKMKKKIRLDTPLEQQLKNLNSDLGQENVNLKLILELA